VENSNPMRSNSWEADQELSILSALREVFSYLSPRRRRQFGPLLALMLFGALAELVSIGAVVPFLAVIVNPQRVIADSPFHSLLESLGLDNPIKIIATVAIVFALSAVLATVVRLLLVWLSQRYVYGVAKELSVAVYLRTLYQPYSYHISHNSSETLAAINKAQLVTDWLLVGLMQAASALVIATFILGGLLFIDPVVASAAGLGFAAIYMLVMLTTRKVMRRQGVTIAKAQVERVQTANEGLGGIRDVLLNHSQPIFVDRFDQVETRLRRAQAVNIFLGQAPRFIVESLGIVLIAGLALTLSFREGGLLSAIPLLGALALGAQRLVPLLQQLYSGWAAIQGNGEMLHDILDILRLPDTAQWHSPRDQTSLPFAREIVMKNVCFNYQSASRPVLKNLNLVLPKGVRVGLVGKTGSGKSTLTDLMLGLLSPSSGRILVDGVALTDANRSAWQAQVAHVPQSIFLADATVAENIAFGVPLQEIDRVKMIRVAEQAQLVEVIEGLPQGYNTFVGERGIRLSGGQRQRIGIARALYKGASVLVFDEATSALDNETEAAVIESIGRLDRSLTILIIAHRITTIATCDLCLRLTDGQLHDTQRQIA